MLLEELINDVQNYLTFSGAMPKQLPDAEIRRIIETDAKTWFHQHHYLATLKEYLYIPRDAFKVDKYTGYKYIELPCNVEFVTWLYQVNDLSLFSFGVNAPNLSVNLGVTNQPYLSSITTTVGELGVYKVIIDGFADMLNQLTKHTLKYSFNIASKQLNILTSMGTNPYEDSLTALVAEVYTQLADEDLFDLDHFRKYVRYKAGERLGSMLQRYDFMLPGGSKINGNLILTEARNDMKTLEEEIKKNTVNATIVMVKR